jgi:hypothetical protein
VHEPECYLVDHVALVQLDCVDTEATAAVGLRAFEQPAVLDERDTSGGQDGDLAVQLRLERREPFLPPFTLELDDVRIRRVHHRETRTV